jgi:hypothetical protein
MNTLNFNEPKSFTNDSRTNYAIFNQSNIFNNDKKPQSNNNNRVEVNK